MKGVVAAVAPHQLVASVQASEALPHFVLVVVVFVADTSRGAVDATTVAAAG